MPLALLSDPAGSDVEFERLMAAVASKPAAQRPNQVGLASIRSPFGALRLPPDPLSMLDVSGSGSRQCQESYELACSMAVAIGTARVLDEHIGSLAAAPPADLLAFRRERGSILFANSFLGAVTSDEANVRRGRPLNPARHGDFQYFDARRERVFGLYEPELHALLFTPHAVPLNHERVTLHELGHARTWRGAYRLAHLRIDLLDGLPPDIAALVAHYAQGDGTESLQIQVLEALAEAYAFCVVGRSDELAAHMLVAVQSLVAGDPLTLRS
jgi:hypothetical protein